MTTEKSEKEDPHYKGHRARLRERFLKNGAEALQAYELLELILFLAIPQRDVKPLAKNLLIRFGNLGGVLHAPLAELQEFGLSENSVAALKTIEAAAFQLLKHDIMHKPILNSWPKVLDYLQATMAEERVEQFRVLYLNKKNELIADEILSKGTHDHTQAYPREIMKRALELSTCALILVHNHPSGELKPSEADIIMTQKIVESAKPFQIIVHDHVIVTKNGTNSLKNLGFL